MGQGSDEKYMSQKAPYISYGFTVQGLLEGSWVLISSVIRVIAIVTLLKTLLRSNSMNL